MHLLSLTARESEFDESIKHYARSYELSRAVWAARSPKFRYEIRASQDLWFASAHATMAARFDPEDSLLMRNALRAAYDSGASHLLIADKYVVLAMLAALEADVDAAVESLSKDASRNCWIQCALVMRGSTETRTVREPLIVHRARRHLLVGESGRPSPT